MYEFFNTWGWGGLRSPRACCSYIRWLLLPPQGLKMQLLLPFDSLEKAGDSSPDSTVTITRLLRYLGEAQSQIS